MKTQKTQENPYEQRIIRNTCGHDTNLNVNTTMPASLIERMVASEQARPCIHCRARHPERGQILS